MRYFKLSIVIATAVFLAWHTQIFIASIEPNPVFSWLASILIECMIIALALQFRQRKTSLIFLIPLYLISTIAASASFIVQNEGELEKMLSQKQQIELLSDDLKATKEAYSHGQKYVTRTLERERRLRDAMLQISGQASGRIATGKAVVFLILVVVMQAVSVYLASTVTASHRNSVTGRNSNSVTASHSSVTGGKAEDVTAHDIPVTTTQKAEENAQRTDTKNDIQANMKPLEMQIIGMRNQGLSYRQIARELGISTMTISRVLKRQK